MTGRWAALAALTCAVLAAAAPAAAGDPTLDGITAGLRIVYPLALSRAGSDLERGTPAYEAALARSAAALLAARPDGCALATWPLLTCGARSFSVPSTSMEPALMLGDTLMTEPVDAAHPVRRGDVLAFRGPLASDKDAIYLSRVIGLPGERVGMHDGIVTIDGRDAARIATGETMSRSDGSPPLARYAETLPDGTRYDVLDVAPVPDGSKSMFTLDTVAEATVPAGHYFMLGDDRPWALDSRYAARHEGPGEPTPADVVGRAKIVTIARDPSRIGFRP